MFWVLFHTTLTHDKSNILVDDSGHVRITDFGLAEISRNPDFGRSASCRDDLSLRWAAPEVWNKGEYSEKADIFSFATVTIEVRHRMPYFAKARLIVLSCRCRCSLPRSRSVTAHLLMPCFPSRKASVRHGRDTRSSRE